MEIELNTRVKLKSFQGTLMVEPGTGIKENFWKLIGELGRAIELNDNGKILVLFDKNLDEFELENHNPIKNTLWIKDTDLELIL